MTACEMMRIPVEELEIMAAKKERDFYESMFLMTGQQMGRIAVELECIKVVIRAKLDYVSTTSSTNIIAKSGSSA